MCHSSHLVPPHKTAESQLMDYEEEVQRGTPVSTAWTVVGRDTRQIVLQVSDESQQALTTMVSESRGEVTLNASYFTDILRCMSFNTTQIRIKGQQFHPYISLKHPFVDAWRIGPEDNDETLSAAEDFSSINLCDSLMIYFVNQMTNPPVCIALKKTGTEMGTSVLILSFVGSLWRHLGTPSGSDLEPSPSSTRWVRDRQTWL